MAQTTLRNYLQETEDAITAGRVDDALARCEHILTQFPEALEAQCLLGEVYLAQNRLEDAQQFFDWVLTNDPENELAYCHRALVCERMSDFDTALDCYQQAYELSRGNSQIRQDFNQLSAKIGQPGFMLSRAGLARLYMRGDLLSQAIQEWETVLSISPDRLDARTGLLETYWREGIYGKVEQIARQLLQDVPGCEKALLLLAFVIVPRNKTEAQELLQRAEVLDPELAMARELFADVMASQPAYPLFQLIKTSPVLLAVEDQEIALPAMRETPPTAAQAEAVVAAVSSGAWRDSSSWDYMDDVTHPPQDRQPLQDIPLSPMAAWAGSANLENPWSIVEPSQSTPVASVPAAAPASNTSFADAWEWETVGDPNAQDAWHKQLEEFPHATQDATLSPGVPSAYDPGLPRSSQTAVSSAGSTSAEEHTWTASTREDEMASAPSWLSMLTQNESPVAPSGSASWSGLTQEPPKMPVSPVPSASIPAPLPKGEPMKLPEESLPAAAAQDDDEPLFFGPEWLKSLGATSMEEEVSAESPAQLAALEVSAPPVADVVSAPPRATTDDFWSQSMQSWTFSAPTPLAEPPSHLDVWDAAQQEPTATEAEAHNSALDAAMSSWTRLQQEHPVAEEPVEAEAIIPIVPVESEVGIRAWQPVEQEAYPSWTAMLSMDAEREWGAQPQEVAAPAEQNLLTTLESLEINLLSRGFVPLEPNTLSAIAQSQDDALAVEAVSPNEQSLPVETPQEQESSVMLSSALAQFGPLTPPAQGATQPPYRPEPVRAVPQWVETPVEPLTHVAASVPVTPLPVPASLPTVKAMPVVPVARVESERPVQSVRASSIPAPVYQAPVEASKAPVARGDALLDNELETTMKRPAIRLQAMQQSQRAPSAPVAAQVDLNALVGRGQVSLGRQESVQVNYQDRLLRGYQHQLVGDYDEAMQEYRFIIRSAPELLGEVVSNVRALLKLAPKYSAGYRVLGDAYMRQGEYLQAMEAYNKALTMAKKARG